jgi:hypothetical protein
MEEIRRETMTRPRMIEIEGRSQETKDMRIEAAEPRWRGGNIYFSQSFRDKPASNMVSRNTPWNIVLSEMTEWPFSEHDDIPDAISDLDKVDKDGKIYCPGPPINWQVVAPKRYQPPMVNGRYNPKDEYSAHDRIRQRPGGNHELWSKSIDTSPHQLSPQHPEHPQNIWRRPQKPRGL